MITDNGTQLVSREMESFLRECGIKHMTTSLYEPRENGQVERFNRVLKESVLCANKSTDAWKEVVRKKLWMYRITRHSVTGVSPFKLLKGKENPSQRFAPGGSGKQTKVMCVWI